MPNFLTIAHRPQNSVDAKAFDSPEVASGKLQTIEPQLASRYTYGGDRLESPLILRGSDDHAGTTPLDSQCIGRRLPDLAMKLQMEAFVQKMPDHRLAPRLILSVRITTRVDNGRNDFAPPPNRLRAIIRLRNRRQLPLADYRPTDTSDAEAAI